MKVTKIYQHKSENNQDLVFKLDSGFMLVKRSEDKIKKFNIARWEEINFLSEDYQEIQRQPTAEELRAIKKYVAKSRRQDKKTSLFARILEKIRALFNKR